MFFGSSHLVICGKQSDWWIHWSVEGTFQIRRQRLLCRFRNHNDLPMMADNVTVVRNLTCANQAAQVRQAGI